MNQLELSNNGSKTMYFTFMPSLNLRSVGEGVEYDVHIKITSYRNNFPIKLGKKVEKDERPTSLKTSTNKLTNNDFLPPVHPRKQ